MLKKKIKNYTAFKKIKENKINTTKTLNLKPDSNKALFCINKEIGSLSHILKFYKILKVSNKGKQHCLPKSAPKLHAKNQNKPFMEDWKILG